MKIYKHVVVMTAWLVHAIYLVIVSAGVVFNYVSFKGFWLNFIMITYLLSTLVLTIATFKFVFDFRKEEEHKWK